jgi:hypothetical protein
MPSCNENATAYIFYLVKIDWDEPSTCSCYRSHSLKRFDRLIQGTYVRSPYSAHLSCSHCRGFATITTEFSSLSHASARQHKWIECVVDRLLTTNGTEHTTLSAAAARKKAHILVMALAISGMIKAFSALESAWKASLLDPAMRFPTSAVETSGRALPTLSTATLWKRLPLMARNRTMPRSWAGRARCMLAIVSFELFC